MTDHSGTLGWGRLNKAGSNLADLEWRAHASLTGVTADQHHNHATATNAEITVSAEQVLTLGSHVILARHTVTGGAALDVVGQTGAGVLARLTPSSDVSAEASGGSILRSAAGVLSLKTLNAPLQCGTRAAAGRVHQRGARLDRCRDCVGSPDGLDRRKGGGCIPLLRRQPKHAHARRAPRVPECCPVCTPSAGGGRAASLVEVHRDPVLTA